jgi:hypothetical protein
MTVEVSCWYAPITQPRFLFQQIHLSWAAKAGHPGGIAPSFRRNAKSLGETKQHELDGLFSQAMTGGW